MIEITLLPEETAVMREMAERASTFFTDRDVEVVDVMSFAAMTSHLAIVEIVALRIEIAELKRRTP